MGNMPAYQPRVAVPRRRQGRLSITVLLVILALLGSLFWQRQKAIDFMRLAGYHPPAQIVSLADDTTMTPYARHIFYVNHPQVDDRAAFNTACKSFGEQTIVLGCYHPDQAGIFVYSVTEPRLEGVEQVTAAHEMLHAAYDRLSSSQRNKVDAMLQDYYAHDLHDQRILDTIASYKKTEPHDVVNEMHSVFGTEASNLPAPLEDYYRQYFSNRSLVVADANNYQGEFTTREKTVADDDQLLKTERAQIDANNQALASQQAALQTERSTMDAERVNNVPAYNASVPAYNAAVDAYNRLVNETTALITSYNQLVADRNASALEVNQLAEAINSQPSTLTTR